MNKWKSPKDEEVAMKRWGKYVEIIVRFFYSKYRLTPSKRKHISEDIEKTSTLFYL